MSDYTYQQMSDYTGDASPEEETPRRRRIRHYKKEEVMRQECEAYVMAGKRLPKLHSRWIYNHYINCGNFASASIGPHNRMVDELRAAKKRIAELEKEQVSPERQAYQAYLAECEKTDAGAQGSLLRLHTDREQELYDAWQRLLQEDEKQG